MDRPPQQHVTHQVSDLPEGQKRLPSPPESNCPQPGRAGRTSDSPPSIHVAHHTSPTSPSRLTSNQAGRSNKNGPKRRGRHMVSCAECRRRKLKCDRSVPCSNCVKRECPDICPSGTLNRGNKDISTHEHRIAQLEALLRERSAPIPKDIESHSDYTAFSSQHQQPSASPQPLDHSPGVGANPSTECNPVSQHTLSVDGLVGLATEHVAHSVPGPEPVYAWSAHADTHPEPQMSLEHGISILPRNSSSHTRTSVALPTQQVPAPRAADDETFGTLVVDRTGRSKYLGPRAGTEWLQNQERPGPSRAMSEEVEEPCPRFLDDFPFSPLPPYRYKEELFSKLPPKEETSILIESYFRSFAWNLTPITRPAFDALFGRVYSSTGTNDIFKRIHLHHLSLLFAIFAMGAHHCLEYPPNDPIVEEYIKLAKCCLSQGGFLVKNTIPGLQALSLIGHLSTETERGRRGDLAWPLYGLAMRLVQAMGLHRDGSKWNLPPDVIEERRLVFWECYTIDIFQAHCFSRPPLMRANHFDTQLPRPSHVSTHLAAGHDRDYMGKDFKFMKYEIVKVLARLLDLTLDVSPPPYERVNDEYEKICAFESSIPFHLRCRDALVATISLYPTPEAAICDSPLPNRRDLKRTFEQFTLAMHVSEAVLFLQRPYFVRAMNENPADPVLSKYGASFLAVVERCNVVTQIVRGLTELHPAVASRHWFFWYHLFNAAVCVGALVLRCPHSPMAPFAMTILNEAISAYSVVTRLNTSSTLDLNHGRLLQLRRRSAAKLSQGSSGGAENVMQAPSYDTSGGDKADQQVDEELLCWRTRLIERGESTSNHQHKSTTIVNKPDYGSGISIDVESGSGTLDSTPPFLEMLLMGTQLPSEDLMMNQHFEIPLEFGTRANEN
ncbi:hypothetical protein V2G26_010985 [Clonostachys chloroleuca]